MEWVAITGVVVGPVAVVGLVVLGVFAIGRDHWFTGKASKDGIEVTSGPTAEPKPAKE
ncbi:MAG: hypothetical protein K2X82_02000 [Gemmataceae bacterium]|nr:hypothetical protein [Gemmataceae bacterium]